MGRLMPWATGGLAPLISQDCGTRALRLDSVHVETVAQMLTAIAACRMRGYG
jgi:hypothetical protein